MQLLSCRFLFCFVFSCHFSWWSSLEKTNWLHHISLLLKATNTVANAIHKEQRPVVVHCSDGWDRTTQIVSLAELMLDPYYRTIEVFGVKFFTTASDSP